MRTTGRSERGLTLLETMVAITIFSIMTIGTVPLLGTALKGGATTRTSSVARNVAAKALERLRGFQYHVAYSSSGPKKVDLLDHFFPGTTPTFVPSVGTGYDSATQSYVTTCSPDSADDACSALPDEAEIPDGYLVEVRATFRSPANPATMTTVPVDYAWNAAGGKDVPPSELLEVRVAVTWSVGASPRTYELRSYLTARGAVAPAGSGGGGGGPAPSPTPGGSVPPPNSVKLRAEARIDYGYEVTTTSQDNATPVRMREYSGTLGSAVAYGEQLDSGSKAELSVRAGQLRIVRPADPAVPGDTGMNIDVAGAALDARAPADATMTTTTTAPAVTATTTETPYESLGWLAPSEAGTLATARGAGPTVAGGLPFVKGYYDLNGTTCWTPMSCPQTHFWMAPQTAAAASGTATTTNPLGLYPTSGATHKLITVNDWQFSGAAANVDPRGEVMVDSSATSPGTSRFVLASAAIPSHGYIVLFPMMYHSSNSGVLMLREFSANVSCIARADASAASSATGTWSAHLTYISYEGDRKNYGPKNKVTTLPTQTVSGNTDVPVGSTNPLQLIRNLNGGNGPKIFDADGDPGDSAYDAYLFAGNGRRGLLTGWSQGSVQSSISADDRVASAQLNGAIRFETSPLHGPWPNPATGQVSQKPNSDMTYSMGKLSCRAEDYR